MLAELARLTSLDEGTPQSFKVRAYENAIHGIEGYPGNIAGLDQKELVSIKGVGGSIATRIREYIDTDRSSSSRTAGQIPCAAGDLLKFLDLARRL